MTDYIKRIGSSAEMLVRDTGSTVQFWLKGPEGIAIPNLQWAHRANGGDSRYLSFDFQGHGLYQHLGTVNITATQEITFHLSPPAEYRTQFGPPVDFIQNIYRPITADYTEKTGPDGEMLMRDLGWAIQFWFRAPPNVRIANLLWAHRANGGDSGYLSFNFEEHGGNWQHLGTIFTTFTQNVTFHLAPPENYWPIIGKPVDFVKEIYRATPPPPPLRPVIIDSNHDSVNILAKPNGDGGVKIDGYEFWWSDTDLPKYHQQTSTPSYIIVGLKPGTKYRFWTKVRNAIGWSDIGPRLIQDTLSQPGMPSAPTFSFLEQTSVYVTVPPNFDGGSPLIEYEVGYGLNPTAPTAFRYSTSGGVVVPNLQPGTTYYFWGKVRNKLGWSDQSLRSSQQTIAGAYVKVGLTYLKAVPYVNDNGVWKLARPWARTEGVWRRSL